MPRAWKFSGRYALLTYSQANDLDPDRIGRYLDGLQAQYVIGRERHSDGNLHYHAFVDFGREFTTRDPRAFDIDLFHPNFLPGRRTPKRMYDYATKDGDIVAISGDFDFDGPEQSGRTTKSGAWAEIIASDTEASFFESVARLDPRALACNFSSLQCYARWKYRPGLGEYIHPADLTFDTGLYPELDAWVDQMKDDTIIGTCFRVGLMLDYPGKSF